MTTYAHLGPRVPLEAHDTAPVIIHAWSIIADLNGLGEAIVSVTCSSHDEGAQRGVLLLALNPRSPHIVRATLLLPGAERIVVEPLDVPGHIADLARTLVRNQFWRENLPR